MGCSCKFSLKPINWLSVDDDSSDSSGITDLWRFWDRSVDTFGWFLEVERVFFAGTSHDLDMIGDVLFTLRCDSKLFFHISNKHDNIITVHSQFSTSPQPYTSSSHWLFFFLSFPPWKQPKVLYLSNLGTHPHSIQWCPMKTAVPGRYRSISEKEFQNHPWRFYMVYFLGHRVCAGSVLGFGLLMISIWIMIAKISEPESEDCWFWILDDNIHDLWLWVSFKIGRLPDGHRAMLRMSLGLIHGVLQWSGETLSSNPKWFLGS